MNKTIYAVIFAAGVALSGVIIWTALKHKYEQQLQEELNAIRTDLKAKYDLNNDTLNDEFINDAEQKPDLEELANRIREAGYGSEGATSIVPHVISPEEYGTLSDYEQLTLIYYADDVLTDDIDNIITDIDDVIGLDSLEHFGEFEDGTVFVRNDERKCDYEVLSSLRKYSDVLNEAPHKARQFDYENDGYEEDEE